LVERVLSLLLEKRLPQIKPVFPNHSQWTHQVVEEGKKCWQSQSLSILRIGFNSLKSKIESVPDPVTQARHDPQLNKQFLRSFGLDVLLKKKPVTYAPAERLRNQFIPQNLQDFFWNLRFQQIFRQKEAQSEHSMAFQ